MPFDRHAEVPSRWDLNLSFRQFLSPGIQVKTAKADVEKSNCLHPSTTLIAQIAVGKGAMTAAECSADLPAGIHNAITTGVVRSTDTDGGAFLDLDAGAPSDAPTAGEEGLNPPHETGLAVVENAVVALAGRSWGGPLADFRSDGQGRSCWSRMNRSPGRAISLSPADDAAADRAFWLVALAGRSEGSLAQGRGGPRWIFSRLANILGSRLSQDDLNFRPIRVTIK